MMHVYNVTQPPGPPGPPRPPQSSTVVKVASKVLSKVDLTATRSALLSPLSQLLPGEEEEYDPHKHRHVAKPTSYSDTMTHLLKACFGAGMLAMPNAMYRLGLVFGTIGVFFLGFIATYCIEILVIAQYKLCKKKKVGYLSYPDAMRMALQEGPPFMRWSAGLFANAVDTFLMIWQFGVCSIFLVFVGENLRQFILYCGKDVPLRIVIACLYPFLAAMCMVKDLKMLAPLSTFSNVCNMAGVALVFYYLIHNDMEIDDSKYKLKSLMDIPVFVGTVLYAMEAVGVILALEHNMDNPKDFTGWCGLFSKGMIVICLVYLILGVFGYLKYGDECQASVTLNLPQEDKKAQAAKLAFAATIFTTYPLQNFVAWQISWSYLEKKFSAEKKHTADLVIRVVCASMPFIFALVAPTLGPFIGLVGSLCLSMVGILFPALIDLSVYYPNEYGVCSYKMFVDIFIMVLGVACCISGVYTSLLEMAQNL